MTDRRLTGVLLTIALVASACGSSAATAGAGSGAPGGASGNVLPSMAAAGGGSCSVNITGAAEKSWTGTQTKGSLLVSYWLSAADLAQLALGPEQAYLILNCEAAAGTVSFTFANGTTKAMFPEAPGDYAIASGGTMSGGTAGQITVLVNLHDTSIWRVSEPGSFKVTIFGGGRFAGTFQAKLDKLAANLTDVAGTATLSGSFDMGCTGTVCG